MDIGLAGIPLCSAYREQESPERGPGESAGGEPLQDTRQASQDKGSTEAPYTWLVLLSSVLYSLFFCF